MITENKPISSNNDSIVNMLAIPGCEQPENDIATSSSSEESTTDGPAVLDANYIESKIKSLLNQAEDEKCDANEPNQAEKEPQINVVFTAEDSCNAVDNKISSGSCNSSSSSGNKLPPEELSFNGKLADLNSSREALHKSFELLNKSGTLPPYSSEKSPDLFDDDDRKEADAIEEQSQSDDTASGDEKDGCGSMLDPTPNGREMDQVDRIERTILERLQLSLSGVLPPPSVTYSHIDIDRMLELYEQNKSYYLYDGSIAPLDRVLLPPACNRPTHTTAQLAQVEWPELLKVRAHGVCYNRSTVTEKIELLGLKYIDRHIGSETGSTFNVPRSPSSSKKRNLRFRVLNQSPGSRLSHLARRRAVFSSANLLNVSKEPSSSDPTQSAGTVRLSNRQILLDPKKSNNRRKNKGRTPKRRTPGRRKTPRRKTPGSSVKKLSLSLSGTQQPVLQSNRESSKRALFQSPPNEKKAAGQQHNKPSSSGVFSAAAAANSKVQKSKRALFSPPKRVLRNSASQQSEGHPPVEHLPKENSISCKRKRDVESGGEEDEVPKPSGKLPRRDDAAAASEQDLTPRSLKLARSQSFCVGAQSSSTRRVSESGFSGKSLFRANSDVMFPNSVSRPVTMLTENHKKKLLWAVSQALQNKQISVKHDNFKQYASNLARVVKRLFLEFNDQAVTSTSAKLLRLANNNVYEVIQGRNVDDIYTREKTRILNARNSAPKLQGYIAPEDFEQHKRLLKRSVSSTTQLSESSMDSSFGGASFTQPTISLSQSSIFSQSSDCLNQLSQISTISVDLNCTEPLVTTTGADRNVLRENIDSEQRQKSAHKQVSFSGRDQKNLSPYADNKASLQAKAKLLVGGAVSSSVLKAKRQISFE